MVTPHKARLTTLYIINLYPKGTSFGRSFPSYYTEISMQSDEKSDCVSATQSLCGVAIICQVVYTAKKAVQDFSCTADFIQLCIILLLCICHQMFAASRIIFPPLFLAARLTPSILLRSELMLEYSPAM